MISPGSSPRRVRNSKSTTPRNRPSSAPRSPPTSPLASSRSTTGQDSNLRPPLSPVTLRDQLDTVDSNDVVSDKDFVLAARSTTDQDQENEFASPHVFERELLMSVSTLIDFFKDGSSANSASSANNDDNGRTGSVNLSIPRCVSGSSLLDRGRDGTVVLNEETLHNVNLFINMLQKTDRELAGELDGIVKCLSTDSYDVASLMMKPETRVALETYIDVVCGKNGGGFAKLNTPGSSASDPSNHRLPSFGEGRSGEERGGVNATVSPTSLKSDFKANLRARKQRKDGWKSTSSPKMEDPPRHVFLSLSDAPKEIEQQIAKTDELSPPKIIRQDSGVAGFRSDSEDSGVGGARSPYDTLSLENPPSSPTRLLISAANSGNWVAEADERNLCGTAAGEDMLDHQPSLYPNTTEASDGPISTRTESVGSAYEHENVEVPYSETFMSNDLDTEALSVLGHYIDTVAGSDPTSNFEESGLKSPEKVNARGFADAVVELDGVECMFGPTSNEALDLTPIGRTVEDLAVPARPRLDPPSLASVSSESRRDDPPTVMSNPTVEDMDSFDENVEARYLSPNHRNVDPEERKSPLLDNAGELSPRTSAAMARSTRQDPEMSLDPPLVDDTGELNPRSESSKHDHRDDDRSRSVHTSWIPSPRLSSAERGGVKIIFFDKKKKDHAKRRKSSATDGRNAETSTEAEMQPEVCGKTIPNSDSAIIPPSVVDEGTLAVADMADKVLSTEELPPTVLETSPLSTGELIDLESAHTRLECIEETPTFDRSPAPSLSVSLVTLPDNEDRVDGNAVVMSVSQIRPGSSSQEIEPDESKEEIDEPHRTEMQDVLENTNAKMRAMFFQNDPLEMVKKLWCVFPKEQCGSPKKAKRKSEGDSFEKFVALVELAFPVYDSKVPTPVEKAHLQVQARRNQIPTSLTNSLIDMLTSLPEQEVALDLVPLSKSIQELSKSQYPSIRKEALLRRLFALKEAEKRRDVMIYSTAYSKDEEEAVEIDLAGDFKFTVKQYESSDDSSSDEPWWRTAAKLTKVLERSRDSDDLDFTSSKDCYESEGDSWTGDESNSKRVRSVNEDINGFWEKRKRRPKYIPLRQRGKLPSVGTASYSATDNEGTSTSGSSVSTSRFDPEVEEELWIRKRDMALWPKGPNGSSWLSRATKWARQPEPINAVNATVYFVRPSFIKRRVNPATKQWRLPYDPRIASHKGYFTVNVQSLYEASSMHGVHHPLDLVPWEKRDVKQRFLQEQSVSYNRNWFGTTKKVYGNARIRQPVCRPKSMEMPMKAGEWTEEWYKKPWESLSISQSLSAADSDLREIDMIRRRYKVGSDEEEIFSWEETPECGTFRNVKLKIGERVSRVTPDLTSSLRRSRWRKKFFPKGTFPY